MKQLLLGKPLSGNEGVLAPLKKRLMEASLRGELSAHLAEEHTEEWIAPRTTRLGAPQPPALRAPLTAPCPP